mmetsp:Transcript_26408/g.55456  ORF Transcript_26408/g.55456 Transcript_26408/m.55456 type:complete len:301 (+) Transcript_26408:169-1071(+)
MGYEEDMQLDLKRLLVLGSGAYSCVTLLLHPLNVLKTTMQANGETAGAIHTAAKLYLTHGVCAFYRGVGPVLFGALPARAAYVGALESVKPLVHRIGARVGLAETARDTACNAAGGFCAVLASQLIYVPVDVVTQRVIVAQGRPGSASAYGEARAIIATNGVLGLYRGFGVSLLAYLPGGTVWWGAYGVVDRSARAHFGLPRTAGHALGAIAAAIATVGTTAPLDLVKTRVQLATGQQAPSVASTLVAVIRVEGVSALYRGAAARFMHLSVWGVAMISVYEELKRRCVRSQTVVSEGLTI